MTEVNLNSDQTFALKGAIAESCEIGYPVLPDNIAAMVEDVDCTVDPSLLKGQDAVACGIIGVLSNKPAVFICDAGCALSAQKPPVCGEDGITYFNECLAFCQDVPVQSKGVCPGSKAIPTDDPSYSRVGSVTKETMNRFLLEGFKFVAKRDLTKIPSLVEPGAPAGLRSTRITPGGSEYVSNGIEIPDGYTKDDGTGIMSYAGARPAPNSKVARVLGDDSLTTDLAGARRRQRQLVVVGKDDRARVSNTTQYPYSVVGQLLFGNGRCSGTVVSRTSVLTNGHCVWNKENKFWSTIDGFAPGRTGGTDGPWNPFGLFTVDYTTAYAAYTEEENNEYDFAVITFKPNSNGQLIGDVAGYAGFFPTLPSSYKLQTTTIIGYHGDKPDGTMWNSRSCERSFRRQVTDGGVPYEYSITYECDATEGSSGSALMDLKSFSYPTVRGLHHAEDSTRNYGVALYKAHFWNLIAWSNRRGVGLV
jgi:V8-like Glu-specific endopeptidase